MEEAEKRVLSLFRTRLANEVVVTASFLSAFCEHSVLDEEMTRIVKSEDNYTAKAHRLLDLLPKRGPKAFSTLQEILEITNPWLAEKMKSALHEEKNRDAKLKTHSSSSDAASIKGYGSSNLRNVDNDVKVVVHQFVKTSLHQLTHAEQLRTERWLGEEMQRERRRQQFRNPHTFRRHPEEFQSCKEVQTDMTGMDFQELCEDIMMQQHGSDYITMSPDISFKALREEISEMLGRQQKMDLLFIQCLEKFDDPDRYALTLPDLIERSMLRQKELIRALMDDRRKMQRLVEERDNLERHVRRLEEELDQLLRRPSSSVVHPQQMYLKKRKEIQARYTMAAHRDRNKKSASGTRATGGGGGGAGGGGGGESGVGNGHRNHAESSTHLHTTHIPTVRGCGDIGAKDDHKSHNDSGLHQHSKTIAKGKGSDSELANGVLSNGHQGHHHGYTTHVHDSSLDLEDEEKGAVGGVVVGGEGGVNGVVGSTSPKPRVRFSTATGSRSAASRRRPGTSSSSGKSVLKFTSK
ncbi:uncharacterized protein [Littorina saxatilis]|uniref:CARD domain-containing protein n=1 Tax=Littorina saxatilis TaxID=31220 RepID=A0AAN9AQE5_9CAEN